jgi:hypothetical protein
MRTVLLLGIILTVISAPPLALITRELVVGSAVQTRYTIERVVSSERGMEGGALRGQIGGHTVELRDDQPVKEHEPFRAGDPRAPGNVWVVVDGRQRSTPARAIIRLERRDANRYWGFVYLMKLVDRGDGDRLVVAQDLGGGDYRTVSIFADGRVVEDQFDYASRCTPPVRAALIRYVVQHPSGYCSDVMQVLPSLWYPVLYPFVSGGLGACLTVIGLVRFPSRRGRRHEELDS